MRLRTVSVVALLCVFAALRSQAAPVVVDHAGGGDYENVQAGVDAAADGDTVLVYPGTYTSTGDRDIVFGTKNLVLRSRDGAETTILNNTSGPGHRLLKFFDGGQDTTCVVDGFTLRNGAIVGATDSGGGAITVDGVANSPSPKFVNLMVEYNYGLHGGGVYINSSTGSANPVFRHCTFNSNIAGQNGGGVYCGMNSGPLLSDCTFVNNESAVGMGGGMHCNLNSDAIVTRSWFEGNAAATQGGGFSVWRSDTVVTNSTFFSNTATGGGGAVSCRGFAAPLFAGVTMARNSAQSEGGSIYVLEGSTPSFINTIVAFTAEVRGDAIACDATGDPTFDVCCVHANFGGDELCGTATNIIHEDPLFCGLESGDLTLMSTSPCLPAWNPHVELIGAHTEGCVAPAVEPATWGGIKALYK
ncbi:MAG: right-handed parallel beta-helix repeat-containing protein [Candidatus Eisenbacteria bacterium]